MRTDSPAEVFALQLNQERFSFADVHRRRPEPAGFPQHRDQPRSSCRCRCTPAASCPAGSRRPGLASAAAADTAGWAGDQAALAAAEAYVMVEQAREYVALLQRARDTVQAHVELGAGLRRSRG